MKQIYKGAWMNEEYLEEKQRVWAKGREEVRREKKAQKANKSTLKQERKKILGIF